MFVWEFLTLSNTLLSYDTRRALKMRATSTQACCARAPATLSYFEAPALFFTFKAAFFAAESNSLLLGCLWLLAFAVVAVSPEADLSVLERSDPYRRVVLLLGLVLTHVYPLAARVHPDDPSVPGVGFRVEESDVDAGAGGSRNGVAVVVHDVDGLLLHVAVPVHQLWVLFIRVECGEMDPLISGQVLLLGADVDLHVLTAQGALQNQNGVIELDQVVLVHLFVALKPGLGQMGLLHSDPFEFERVLVVSGSLHFLALSALLADVSPCSQFLYALQILFTVVYAMGGRQDMLG